MARRNRTLEILTQAGLAPQELAIEQARGQRDARLYSALASLLPQTIQAGTGIASAIGKADIDRQELALKKSLGEQKLALDREELEAKEVARTAGTAASKAAADKAERDRKAFEVKFAVPALAPLIQQVQSFPSDFEKAEAELNAPMPSPFISGANADPLLGPAFKPSPNRTLASDQRSGLEMLRQEQKDAALPIAKKAMEIGVDEADLIAAGNEYSRPAKWREEDIARRAESERKRLEVEQDKATATRDAARIAKGEKAAEKAKSYDKEEIAAIQGMVKTKGLMNQIAAEARKSKTGGGAARMFYEEVAKKLGVNTDATTFNNLTGSAASAYQKAVTGLGGSAREIDDIQGRFPRAGDSFELIDEKIRAFDIMMLEDLAAINTSRRLQGKTELTIEEMLGASGVPPAPAASPVSRPTSSKKPAAPTPSKPVTAADLSSLTPEQRRKRIEELQKKKGG